MLDGNKRQPGIYNVGSFTIREITRSLTLFPRKISGTKSVSAVLELSRQLGSDHGIRIITNHPVCAQFWETLMPPEKLCQKKETAEADDCSEQPDNPAVRHDVDFVGGGNFGQAGHGHDVAANGDDEFGSGGKTDFSN